MLMTTTHTSNHPYSPVLRRAAAAAARNTAFLILPPLISWRESLSKSTSSDKGVSSGIISYKKIEKSQTKILVTLAPVTYPPEFGSE